MKAMLLAAGEGTRFRPHTLKVPKPALPFLNIPMGYYSFPFLKSADVKSLVVNTFHLPHMIEDLYTKQTDFSVNFTHETGKILGNGGGLENAKNHFLNEESFLLLNSDEVIIPFDSNFLVKMSEQHRKNKPISTLLVMDHPEVGTKFGGVWVDDQDRVIGFGKTKPDQAKKGYHFLGIQILSPNIFEFLPVNTESNILYDGLTAAIKNKHSVQLYKIEAHWYETGNLTDYLQAQHNILKGIAESKSDFYQVHKFLMQNNPNSGLETINDALVWKDNSARLAHVRFKNFAVVGKNAELSDVAVDYSVIAPYVQMKSAEVKNQLVLY